LVAFTITITRIARLLVSVACVGLLPCVRYGCAGNSIVVSIKRRASPSRIDTLANSFLSHLGGAKTVVRSMA